MFGLHVVCRPERVVLGMLTVAPRRYDIYGFRKATLDEAARIVERTLGVPLRLRESSYSGIYYCGVPGLGDRYLVEENVEGSRWHKEFGEFRVTLMISEQPDMDAIHDRFKAQGDEPVLLRTIVRTEDPPDVLEPDEDAEDAAEDVAEDVAEDAAED